MMQVISAVTTGQATQKSILATGASIFVTLALTVAFPVVTLGSFGTWLHHTWVGGIQGADTPILMPTCC